MPKKFSKKPTTSFKNRVLAVVKKIPRGQTINYQRVAFLAGRPRACRAVGNILNQNKNPAIPCHRVVRANGKLAGYNRGIKKKERLLKKEGVILNKWRVCSFPKKNKDGD